MMCGIIEGKGGLEGGEKGKEPEGGKNALKSKKKKHLTKLQGKL